MRTIAAILGAFVLPGRTRTVTLVLVASVVLWEAAVLIFQPRPFVLPAPSVIFAEIDSDVLWYTNHAVFTLVPPSWALA